MHAVFFQVSTLEPFQKRYESFFTHVFSQAAGAWALAKVRRASRCGFQMSIECVKKGPMSESRKARDAYVCSAF